MRIFYCLLLLLIFFLNGCTHRSSKDISVITSDISNTPFLEKEGSVSCEFTPISENARLSLFVYDYSKNAGDDFVKPFPIGSLNKNSGTKIYTVFEHSQKNVNILIINPGNYTVTYPKQAVSDNKIHIHAFNTETNIENDIVPIVLLIDYNNVNDLKAINALKQILECSQLEDFNESDIEYLKSKSNLLNVFTYKMESQE